MNVNGIDRWEWKWKIYLRVSGVMAASGSVWANFIIHIHSFSSTFVHTPLCKFGERQLYRLDYIIWRKFFNWQPHMPEGARSQLSAVVMNVLRLSTEFPLPTKLSSPVSITWWLEQGLSISDSPLHVLPYIRSSAMGFDCEGRSLMSF